MEITRVFNYPRDAVFRMWTDQRRVAKWWGPEGCSVTVCEVDPREGGAMKIDTRNPDGSVYPMTGTFTKVAAPELLAFRSAGPGPGGRFGDSPWTCLNTVTFEELSHDRTRITVTVKVVMAAPKVIDALEQGFKGGWAESFQRLQEALG